MRCISLKYCSIDHLHDFDFHDVEMKLEDFTENTLIVSAKHLNIHKGTAQNDSEYDMEIDLATMTFTGFSVESYEPDRTWKTDENGNSDSEDPVVIYTGQEACQRLYKELKCDLCVFSLTEEDHVFTLDGCGDSPYFVARFTFDSVRVEWDSYRKKAWYELHRYYKREICLTAPEGDQKVKLEITCHDEDVYSVKDGRTLEAPLVIVCLRYGDQDYLGVGSDDYWMDAFADLQKHLPQGVTLKCCLTCRHGNLCPTGNNIDEVFCTQDVSITQKSDLYFYTEDPTQRETRRRGSTDHCGNFEPQSERYYTYK